jgi:membrane fusion protein, multidrug efflux system
LALARTEFKRMEELVTNKAVSQSEYDQKKSAVEVWSAKQLAQEAAVVQAKLNVEYTKIVSPIDGRAGARLVDMGNVVKANEGTMLTIQRLDPIYAEFTITENDLGTVRKYIRAKGLELGDTPEQGLKVLVDLPADSPKVIAAIGAPTASTQPGKGQIGAREGTLTFLDNAVQSGAGTVKLRATVPNKDGYFWPGQFVNTRLVLATKKAAVLIPIQAQQIGQQGPFLYVIEKNDKGAIAKIRPIQPGQRHGDMLVVDKGLQPGEQVVVTGQMLVAPNGPVMVTNAAALIPTTQPADATALR